jgi:hypothetical protein
MTDRRARDDELDLHDSLGRWACDHADRFDEIGVVGYEPARRPEQRLATAKTAPEASAVPGRPERSLVEAYGALLGEEAAQAQAAFANGVGGELRDWLAAGRSVAVVTAHADRLHDIGTLYGAVAIALADSELISRNATILNKVMSREAFRGIPVAQILARFGAIYWVVPDTASAERWGISPRVSSSINARAMRALLADMRSGLVLTLAPSGTAVRAELGTSGRVESLTIPQFGAATAHLLSRFDGYVAGAVWGGRVSLGKLTALGSRRGKTRGAREASERHAVQAVANAMIEVTENATGLPVRYDAGQG